VDTANSSATAQPSTDEPRECFACYEGLVYIGHLEMTEEGEEVEVIVAVPCRRCNPR
jgi:inorganic pyrophosphatase